MARGPLGVTRAGRSSPGTVKYGGPGSLDFTVRSIRGGRRRVMEELAPLAMDFEPRLERAVTRWQELTPWQRRSVTLDDLAEEAGLENGEFLGAIVQAAFQLTHDLTDLLVACAFPAVVAAAAKRAQHPDGVLDRQLIFEQMNTARERAAEHARRGAGRNATHGVDDSDQLGFLRKDPDVSEHTHDR